MVQRPGRSIAALLLVAGGLGWTTSEPATAVSRCSSDPGQSSIQDVNDDSYPDVVVGVPLASSDGRARAGVVDVHHPTTSVPPQRFGESYLGQTPVAGDGFGSAVAYTSLDAPQGNLALGCPDLLIGAPGAAGGRGRVTVALASPSGILPGPTATLTGRHPGDHFGAAVSVVDQDVWVGAPDQVVRGRAGAGAVYHYRVTGDGTLHLVGALTEDSPGIPGVAEVDDHFGEVLSAGFGGFLAVGEPGEDAGRLADAGAVTVVTTRPDGAVAAAAKVGENSPGVPGVAAAGDRFGASVAGKEWLLVGVPGADVRGRRHAGAVQLFDVAFGRSPRLRARARVTQESTGMPGASEVGDQFGAAVQSGNEDCVWIGVPGDGLGGAAGTGEVLRTHRVGDARTLRLAAFGTVIRLGGPGSDNIPGAPQRGSHVGASLATEAAQQVEDTTGGETVVVAVPGLDGPATGSGQVWISRTSPSVGSQEPPTTGLAAGAYTDSAGAVAHEHYGTLARARTNGAAYGG